MELEGWEVGNGEEVVDLRESTIEGEVGYGWSGRAEVYRLNVGDKIRLACTVQAVFE